MTAAITIQRSPANRRIDEVVVEWGKATMDQKRAFWNQDIAPDLKRPLMTYRNLCRQARALTAGKVQTKSIAPTIFGAETRSGVRYVFLNAEA